MPVSCLFNREAYQQKLQRHRQHYKRTYPQVKLKAQRLVRKQIWKLNTQIKALT